MIRELKIAVSASGKEAQYDEHAQKRLHSRADSGGYR